MGFWIQLAIAIALSIVSYLLMPKPRTNTNPQSQDLKEPTAEAGKPVPVVFGEIMIQSPNVLYFGDLAKRQYKVNA